MRRREFIAGLGYAAAWPVVAQAQQPAIPIVGFLHNGSLDEQRRDLLASFLKGLAETGYIEGSNVAIEYRWGEFDYDRLSDLVTDLVRRRVAVIATLSNTATALTAKAVTKDIPIVFLVGTDPVQIGLVASLNRPGGNLTGVAILQIELAAKRLELLHELVPAAALIAYLSNPANPIFADTELREVQAAAQVLGVRIVTLSASTPREIDAAFESLVQARAGALLVGGDAVFGHDQLTALAARHQVPAIYARREAALAGGLIAYGADTAEASRLVGVYSGRILKGEKPADLPVQQSTKVELVLNMKTAKALDLTVPQSILLRADEVIE